MRDKEAKEQIEKLYNAFNTFYYNGECVPEFSNLAFNIDLLEDAADGDEGKTTLSFSVKEETAQITIQIKKEICADPLHLAAVLLHEMVHAYLYARKVFELDETKTTSTHGEAFKNAAREHGLQDGYILPNDEIIYIFKEEVKP